MKIFKEELSIAEKIEKNNSISCYSKIEPIKATKDLIAIANSQFSTDDIPDTDDLYFMKSILVSTVTNKNRDTFLPAETWAARFTPNHKAVNIGHDHTKIVGHICSTWAIDANGNVLDNTLAADEVPDLFHLANSEVIYRSWQMNEELGKEVEDTIAAIDRDELAVSMEAIFSDFDYIAASDSEVFIIPRSADTAFLTKHLVQYGGTGEFDGFQLARAIKSIRFSQVGIVANPANESSIIFTKDCLDKKSCFGSVKQIGNPFAKAQKNSKNFIDAPVDGVYSNVQPNVENKMDKPNNDLMAEVKKLQAEKAQLQEELSKADVQKYIDKAESLTKDLAEAKDEIVKAEEAKACMCNQFDEVNKAKEDLEAQNKTLREKLEELKTEAVRKARLAVFSKKGFSDEEAVAKVDELAPLDDEMFAKVSNMVTDKTEQKNETNEIVAEEEVDTAEAEAEDSEVSETTEASEEVTGNDDSDEPNEEMSAQAAVASYYANVLVKENK